MMKVMTMVISGSEDYNNNNEDHIEVDAKQAYSRRESNTSMVEECRHQNFMMNSQPSDCS